LDYWHSVSIQRKSTAYSTRTLSSAQLSGPFGSCAFAWLTPLLPGSLKIALKRTRPRQRFCYLIGANYTPMGGIVKAQIGFVANGR